MRLPHPVLLLLAGTAIAACLTWMLPPGEFDRRDDPSTGRRVVVAGTYHPVDAAPVSPFAAAVAVPRGIVAAADVVGVILFVGGAWFVLDRLGTLTAVVGALVRVFGHSGLMAIPPVVLFFAAMGALENMQEEIIPLVPVLLLLGRGLGIDAVTVVAMSAGAAMVGSAFGPTNPFQAGIALKLAQEPPLSGGALRSAMFVVSVLLWIGATLRHAARHRTSIESHAARVGQHVPLSLRHALALVSVLLPMAFYVYGALRLGWGFNELSAAFLVGGGIAGLIGGLGPARTAVTYLHGMETLVPAAVMVGIARSISMVLEDGRVVDTILNALANGLATFQPTTAALFMVPFHALVHVAVPSISGQAVLTMPLMVPLADLLHFSRQVSVLAYQTGGGLMELVTPTNGALMAVLLAADVPYEGWLRFVAVAVPLQVVVGIGGIIAALVWLR
jgi:uncharacterized ion transporter superfamily protein YfcC